MIRGLSSRVFHCAACGHAMKAPKDTERRMGRCPQCHAAVIAPPTAECVPLFNSTATEFSRRPLRGLAQGVLVSVIVHAVLLTALGIVFLKSQELGRTIIVSLLLESEGMEPESLATPMELPLPMPSPSLTDSPAASEGPSWTADELPATPPVPGSTPYPARGLRTSPISPQPFETISRFSPTVTNRLSKVAAAKRGDYEIALFWEGPTDLDLHVRFVSPSEKIRRHIYYGDKGKPATGFLDVDQNAIEPFVANPIEHIRWNIRSLPPGTYFIQVHCFKSRTPNSLIAQEIPYTIEFKSPEGVRVFQGEIQEGPSIDIARFSIDGPDPESESTIKDREALQSPETAASQLLETAEKKLAANDRASYRMGIVMLKSVARKYPRTPSAEKARQLLKTHQ